MSKQDPGQWPKAAKFFLEHIGPPLRPVAENTAFIQEALDSRPANQGAGTRALILGVTPEYYHLNCPQGTELGALDHTAEMIEFVWPGPKEYAACGDWLDGQYYAEGFDVILCDDGHFSTLA